MDECTQEASLYCFSHKAVLVVGTVRLPLMFGKAPKHVQHFIKLYVVNTPSSYNMILDRPIMVKLKEIT